MRKWWLVAALLALPSGAWGQQSDIGAPCTAPGLSSSAREFCGTVAQAVESAQPQLGILVAGGNPTLGVASTGGLRLGSLPRVSAIAKVNLVLVRLPEILAEQAGGTAQRLNESTGLPAPAVSGTVSVGLFPGVRLAPTLGGIGSVDLLGSATWLPFTAFDLEGFGDGSAQVAYGGGVKVGLLRESFLTPGVAVSVLYRSLGTVSYGDVCPGTERDPAGAQLLIGRCIGEGDRGEFSFDLADWSTRAAIGKRLLGVGLTAGIGYDRLSSDIGFGFRDTGNSLGGAGTAFARVRGLQLDNDRWSAFANASITGLFATLALEAGWLQGSEPIPQFPRSASEFDPADGSLFGSLGLRLAF